MNPENIVLISFGQFEAAFLLSIAREVKREFHHPVRIREGHLDLSEHYDAVRGQYNANSLLKAVDQMHRPEHTKTFGLFQVDLFIPILTFIFGQAFLNGRSGIASLYRFRSERYGMKSNEDALLERFTKEVIHELGHTFGLVHCYFPGCVMQSSTYIEDIDQKNAGLCAQCREKLNPG
ncbi:MAG TPA: archaemetzincin [Bacteroidales bacterium]|nr:archaemetzincin [Bacteroidales bacterium]HSA42299.1 archaemetzincin [Bacteroidales bacterium]